MAAHEAISGKTCSMPRATYRLQLTHRFGFADAERIVPYLAELGVSDLYCSPIVKARTGSEHCYDAVDPTQINPELGGESAFYALSRQLKAHGMGLLLDIVPNHMAVSPENEALMHVLEYGPASPFADWFDITWHAAGKQGAIERGVQLPILGKELNAAIADGEVTVVLEGSGVGVRYFDWRLPVCPGSLGAILRRVRVKVPAGGGHEMQQQGQMMEELAAAADRLPQWRKAYGWKYLLACDDVKRQLGAMLQRSAEVREGVEKAAKQINASSDALREVLEQQVYELRYWKDASRDLTYRRFFDISDLIGVCVEQPHVFKQTHELVLRLMGRGHVAGFRVDHIDGLAGPRTYLQMLQDAAGQQMPERFMGNKPQCVYVVVEKILEGAEELDEYWPVAGGTGYAFLNAVNEMFVDEQGLTLLGEHHAQVTGRVEQFEQRVRQLKAEAAKELFEGEVNALLAELKIVERRVKRDAMREALVELSSALPVYRTYAEYGVFYERDRRLLEHTFKHLERTEAMVQLERIMLGDFRNLTQRQREARQRFITRWQQLTGPLMAKGLEDTALYQDARLISLNEVGMDPRSLRQPRGIEQFHDLMSRRSVRWGGSLNATATHDTKRGEDVRARINVLSEMAGQWIETAERWMGMNGHYKAVHRGESVPDPCMELFLYQTAIGFWPMDDAEEAGALERLARYAIKAAREAKTHTSWIEQDVTYEEHLEAFVREVFDPGRGDAFMREFRALHGRVAWYGALSSLSQVLIKATAPSVPDVYQGCELWDLSLVDPDNRRPVDFDARQRYLREISGRPIGEILADVVEHWRDGRVKMWLLHRALRARREQQDVYMRGSYEPLKLSGIHAGKLCAFARRFEDRWAITIAPVQMMGMGQFGVLPTGKRVWEDTKLHLPAEGPRQWANQLTEEQVDSEATNGGRQVDVAQVLTTLPWALLYAAA